MAKASTSDSVVAARQFRDAAKLKPPEPPAGYHLREAGQLFWGAGVMSRDLRDWTPMELRLLAQAAALDDEIADLQAVIAIEGSTYMTKQDAIVAHPAATQLNASRRLQLSLVRQLHLTMLEPPTVASRAKKAMEAREAAESDDDEDDGLD